ncbi:MAG: lipopolysaccharide assembly protein LapA domain-containing protein [bacterium]
MVVLRIVLVLVVFTLLLVLGLTNARELADVNLFGAVFPDVPVVYTMLYSFAFGAACVGVFSLVSEFQLRARIRRLRREIEALTEELRAFRNAPLDDDLTAGSTSRYEP